MKECLERFFIVVSFEKRVDKMCLWGYTRCVEVQIL